MKSLFFIFLVAVSLWFPSAYKRWTHPFRLAKCLVEWPFTPEWEIDPPENMEEIRSVLSEPFSYLAKGAQSYVFLSQNEKYVLKLFRYDTCKLPVDERTVRRWIGAREKHFLPTDVKIEKNFTSCKLAYSLAQKQTEVVFVHLNPKSGLPILTLKDRLGRVHKIDPKAIRFALQKKGEPFIQTLYAHRENLQPFIDSYLTLLHELGDLGLVNLDPTMGRNFGFIDGRAIQMDFGNFVYRPERASADTVHFEQQLKQWLKKRIPEAS